MVAFKKRRFFGLGEVPSVIRSIHTPLGPISLLHPSKGPESSLNHSLRLYRGTFVYRLPMYREGKDVPKFPYLKMCLYSTEA